MLKFHKRKHTNMKYQPVLVDHVQQWFLEELSLICSTLVDSEPPLRGSIWKWPNFVPVCGKGAPAPINWII